MRARTLPLLGLLTLGAVALSSCASPASGSPAASDPNDPITFAMTPLGDDPTAVNPITEFARLVTEKTGRKVEIVDVPDYTAVVEAIRNHHVDIGFMSGFPSALAVNTGQVDALMAWPGTQEPVSTCLVKKDSQLQALQDIKPETVVAFADPASSSGYFMPVTMLHGAGLEKDVDYKPLFSGGHDMSFIALKEGQVDVACTSTIFPKMVGTDMFPFAEGEVRSIGESGSMPVSMTMLADQKIADDKRQVLLDALPKILVEENAEALGAILEGTKGAAPIAEPSNEIFKPFVDMAAIADVDISDLG